jgi:hypothetical protein
LLTGQRQAFLRYHMACEPGEHQSASTAVPI